MHAALFGPGRFWFWVFGGANGGYFDVGNGGLRIVADRMLSMNGAIIGLNVGLLALAVLAVRSFRTDLDIWLWLLSAVIGVVVGHPLLQPLLLAAVPPAVPARRPRARRSLAEVEPPRRRRRRPSRRPGAAIAAALFRIGGPSNDYNAIADYAKAHTAADERIFVWGHEPSVFWAADRLPALAHHHDRVPHRPHRRPSQGFRRDGQGGTPGACGTT